MIFSERKSTKSPVGIEALPTELRIHVLRSLTNMKSLDNLIKVSKIYLETYKRYEMEILPRMVTCQFRVDMLNEMKAFASAYDLSLR